MSSREVLHTSPSYLDRLKRRNSLFKIKCACSICNWTEYRSINEIEYSSLEEMSLKMNCPRCSNIGIRITVVTRDFR